MTRSIAAAALAAAAFAPATALAAPDRTVSINTTDANTFKYAGAAALGLNVAFTGPLRGCGKDVQNFCDTTLVHVDDVYTATKKLTIRLDGFTNSDYDLRVYTSDANGTRGSSLPAATTDDGGPIGAVVGGGFGDFETVTTPARAGTYYLVDIAYWASDPRETPDVTLTLG